MYLVGELGAPDDVALKLNRNGFFCLGEVQCSRFWWLTLFFDWSKEQLSGNNHQRRNDGMLMLAKFGSVMRRDVRGRGRLLLASSLSVIGGMLATASLGYGATVTSYNPVEAGTTSGADLLTSSSGISTGGSDLNPDLVNPGDTFGIDVSAFNSGGTIGYLITPDEVTTFGTTTTFTGAGYNGQNITVSSSESIGLTTTTDTVTVTTPTNFLTSTTIGGTKMTQMQLDIGDANAGGNTIDFALPIGSQTSTGSLLYSSANNFFALTPAVTLTNGTQSLSAAEGVSYGTTAISTLAVHSFTYSVTYATAAVPEPAAVSILSVLTLGLLRRRSRSLA